MRKVLETHGHWDHIQAVPDVRDAGYEVGVTEQDASMLPSYDVLTDESVIEVGRLRLHTIHTPGHTAGSMCFRVEGSPVLFTGDTLFPGGPGNTTFAGGDFNQIIRSIEDRCSGRSTGHPGAARATALDTTVGQERPTSTSGSPEVGERRRPALPRRPRPTTTPIRTDDLPATPPADRNIPAEAWIEAPPELLALGDDIGADRRALHPPDRPVAGVAGGTALRGRTRR